MQPDDGRLVVENILLFSVSFPTNDCCEVWPDYRVPKQQVIAK
jgi:hypothetical protein